MGSIRGQKRQLIVVGCYIPPGYDRQRGREAIEFIENMIIQLKRRFMDPYLVIAGDFNQWKVED